MAVKAFKIIPILGRKTDVSPEDPTMFQSAGEGVSLTHDAGGINYDITRKINSCSKSNGKTKWTSAANAQATKCLGLFELNVSGTREHLIVDNGKVFAVQSDLTQLELAASPAVTFHTGNASLMCFIQVGAYAVMTDAAGSITPYKWASGDANLTKLIASGTEFKFRYLEQFQRRVLGAYSDQTDGDIDLRWSTPWPQTAIAALNFPAANQIYIPNDDSIVGIKTMGHDRCYIYCDNSIQQLVYFEDYEIPFRCYTICPKSGGVNHHSIVNLGDRHYMFNRHYGFCEYRGGNNFPSGGRPISSDIEKDLQSINADYYNLIVGTFIPLNREILWTVPMDSSSTPNRLVFWNIDTGQWRFEDKAMRFVDEWRLVENYTWNDFVTEIGGTGIWSDAGENSWAYYASVLQRLVFANIDGYVYYRDTEANDTGNIDGYRIEPIMDFGAEFNMKLLAEIWFNIGNTGAYSIDVYHRSGNTVGELLAASFTSVGSISCASPARPVVMVNKTARYHQIKWGTDLANEPWQVHDIVLKYQIGSDV
jgi:hypothetical protein